MSKHQLKTREEQPEAYTWDLSSMYATLEDWEADYQLTEQAIEAIAPSEGTLSEGPHAIAKAIEQQLAASLLCSRVYTYAHLVYDQDSTNGQAQQLNARALQLYSKLSQATAYFNPELLSIPEATLATWLEESEVLQHYRQLLDDVTRERAHVLSTAEESLLAQMGEVFRAPYETFSLLNNADFEFPMVTNDEGQEIQLSHGVYSTLLESPNREVRRNAFEKLYGVYDQFKNTLASVLSSNVKVDNVNAKVRRFKTAREASLFKNGIPESVYDTLVSTVGDHLNLLHRYTALRAKLLGIEKLEMYDMYTPLLGETPIKITIEEAKKMVLEALAPMGTDYVAIMEKAFNERWIDWYENKGKRSGAYSSGMYDSKPYILLNWQDDVNWLYTLVHELGHSAHTYLSKTHQAYEYSGYSIFLAEIASTTNENLLTDYLLKRYDDPQIRLFVLNHFLDGLKGTMFRQTQFAEFEHFMHEADAAGKPLTHEFLSEHYRQLNEKYYGPSVNSDSLVALEWSRIPHFYYNYYVFQYATGFAAATFFADKILKGDQEALQRYLGFLKSGSSDYPIETMKRAGLDMTQRDYIEAALKVFEQRLNEFETLLATQA